MITYKIYTDVGGREINEDSVGMLDEKGRYCFTLADGLGGHGRGECASAIAVRTSLEMFVENFDEDFLEKSFNKTQENITYEQENNPELADMKTTMVSLVIWGNMARYAHIGDSRLYQFYKNKVVTRTLDHSVPQMLVNTGEIKEKDIRGHEDRNRLLRVMGSPWNNNHSFDVSEPIALEKCQAFLLCSDGFWELIDEKKMTAYLKKASSVEEWLEFMIDEVKANGIGKNMDNNSAIAVWINKEEA